MRVNIKKTLFILLTIIILLLSIEINTVAKPKLTIISNELTFEDKILFYMKLAHAPSLSACIIKNNTLIWSQGFGYADIKNSKPATENTIYMAGSISKTITATAFMQLYEKGYFKLDDDVNKYLPFSLRNPNFPDTPITIRMLLSHQSSLQDTPTMFLHFLITTYPYEWLKEYLTPGGCIYDPNVWNSKYAPGEHFSYSNIGYEVLGYIFEIISNQTLEEYCQKNIFNPLDMKHTSFHASDFDIKDLAVPYFWLLGHYIPFPHYDIENKAAGGIRSNVIDLAHLLIAHMNNGIYNNTRILNSETIKLMHSPQYPNNSDSSFQYGLGWEIHRSEGTIYEGHSGSVFGGIAFMFFRESDNIGVIFFINKNRILHIRPYTLETIGLTGIKNTLFEKAEEL